MQHPFLIAASSANRAHELLSSLSQGLGDFESSIPICTVKEWPLQFPPLPGVYVIYTAKEYLYVGETADIRSRMRDLQDTRNHSLRRSIGKHLAGITTTASKKFESGVEKNIDDWLQVNARVQFLPTFLARKELEEWLILKYNPTYNRPAGRSRNHTS